MLDLVIFHCPSCNEPFRRERTSCKVETLVWNVSARCKRCLMDCTMTVSNDEFEDMIIDVLVFHKPNNKTLKGICHWPNNVETHEQIPMEVII